MDLNKSTHHIPEIPMINCQNRSLFSSTNPKTARNSSRDTPRDVLKYLEESDHIMPPLKNIHTQSMAFKFEDNTFDQQIENALSF